MNDGTLESRIEVVQTYLAALSTNRLLSLNGSESTGLSELVSLSKPASLIESSGLLEPVDRSESTSLLGQFAQISALLTELQEMVGQQQQAEAVAYHEAAAQHEMAVQYETLLIRYQRDRQLARVTQQLRQSLDPREIADQTVAAIQQLLQVDRAVIYQFHTGGKATIVAEASVADSSSLYLKAEHLKAEPLKTGHLNTEPSEPLKHPETVIPVTLGQTLGESSAAALIEFCTGFCQTTGVTVLDQIDLAVLPAGLQEFVQQQQATALLAAPIRQGGALLGLISAHHWAGSRVWQPDDIELLQQLSLEVAIALQHSELYQRAQELNADLEQQVAQRTQQLTNALDYESTLKRITDRVRDSLDERHILEAALQELTLVLGLAGCNAAIYDLNQNISIVQYEFTQSIPASQGRVAQMENFPEIYQQLKQGRWFQFCSLLPNPVRGRVAMLACPIFFDPQSVRETDQAVLGDLWLIHQHDHMFEESEIRLVQQVANQCAIAIRQARLYQAAQGQVQELAELNRLKDEFLSTVSHELRTPITNIKMAIQMLRNSSTDERRAKYISILEQEATREADLINDLLDLQQLQASSRRIGLEPIVLQDWLPKLAEPFQPRFTARQHQFQIRDLTDLPPFASELTSLRRILAELLNNACKYTVPGGEIYLAVELEAGPSFKVGFKAESSTDSRAALIQSLEVPAVASALGPEATMEYLTFIICNQATIPEVELPKIFDKFYRCPHADPWKQGGTGLGLALVKKLVERLQGEIRVSSYAGWTEFRVKLPALEPFLDSTGLDPDLASLANLNTVSINSASNNTGREPN